MQQVEHFVFILVMLFIGVGIAVTAYKRLKREVFFSFGSRKSHTQLFRKQEQLNKAFEKILDEHKKYQHRTDKSNDTSKPSHMEQQKAKYAKAYQLWTKDEDDSLKRMYAHGESMAAMKLVFQRGEGAIRSRINKICQE